MAKYQDRSHRLKQFADIKNQVVANEFDTALITMTEAEHKSYGDYGNELTIKSNLCITNGSAKYMVKQVHQVMDDVIQERSRYANNIRWVHTLAHASIGYAVTAALLAYVIAGVMIQSLAWAILPAILVFLILCVVQGWALMRWWTYDKTWYPLSMDELIVRLKHTPGDNYIFMSRQTNTNNNDLITDILRNGLLELRQESSVDADKALALVISEEENSRAMIQREAMDQAEFQSNERIAHLVLDPYRQQQKSKGKPHAS